MKVFRGVLAVFALALLGAAVVAPARADTANKKTILTFSYPLEVPGQVLPAGKYVFRLQVPSLFDRNIVQIWNEDESKLLTTVLAISDYRLKPTAETVIEFHERAGNAPHALRAWFYPGDNTGREFVYPKRRAEELAKTNNVIVPAESVDATASNLTSVPLVAMTPKDKEEPVAEAFTPPQRDICEGAPNCTEIAENVLRQEPALGPKNQLPKTASPVPLIVLIGGAFVVVGIGLRRLAKQNS